MFQFFMALVFAMQVGAAEEAPSRFVKFQLAEGVITIELDEVHAPLTTKNFLAHVAAGDYDKGTFYRAVTKENENSPNAPIQVVQGGAKSGVAEAAAPIALESTETTGLRHFEWYDFHGALLRGKFRHDRIFHQHR